MVGLAGLLKCLRRGPAAVSGSGGMHDHKESLTTITLKSWWIICVFNKGQTRSHLKALHPVWRLHWLAAIPSWPSLTFLANSSEILFHLFYAWYFFPKGAGLYLGSAVRTLTPWENTTFLKDDAWSNPGSWVFLLNSRYSYANRWNRCYLPTGTNYNWFVCCLATTL